MTRINLIPVEELTDQHLLAEHREIKRIPNVMLSGRFSLEGQPKEFVLGTGHVKFFYDKSNFLRWRYVKLHIECFKRGFKMKDYMDSFINYSCLPMKFSDWRPTKKDIALSRERIEEKIKAKPGFYRKRGILID